MNPEDVRYGDGTPFPGGRGTIFSHLSDRGVARHWHIERLLSFSALFPRIEAPIDMHMVAVIMDRRGIEPHRLERMTREALALPMLFVEMEAEFAHEPPVSHLLVDGNHRYVYAALNGIPSLPAIIIPKAVSDKCLILGVPEDKAKGLLSMPSGVK